jgi:hypothetical protein
MLARAVRVLSLAATTSALKLSAQLNAKSTAGDVLEAYKPLLPGYVTRGATAVVTGGNSGIGLEAVKTLHNAGCSVVLCSRSVEAGEAALKTIGLDGAPGVRVQRLDLADLTSVKDAAVQIAQTDDDVSLVLNNAGIMATPQLTTKQVVASNMSRPPASLPNVPNAHTHHAHHHALSLIPLSLLTAGLRAPDRHQPSRPPCLHAAAAASSRAGWACRHRRLNRPHHGHCRHGQPQLRERSALFALGSLWPVKGCEHPVCQGAGR